MQDLPVAQIEANEFNPRLDFPADELELLAESIDNEGILVPIVVYPDEGKYVLIDGERRFRCAVELGFATVPALITTRKSDLDMLKQMFSIQEVREPWRDMPTAKALQRLAESLEGSNGREPTDTELRDATGLSVERVRRFRYVVTLPADWQEYIRQGTIPLNFFWELKRNVIDPLANRRPEILAQLGKLEIETAFVNKRLRGVITDTVSLRKVAPIIKFAAQDAADNGTGQSALDQSIKDLIDDEDATIEDVYEDTVEMLVEVDKLERRTRSMTAIFTRLLADSSSGDDTDRILNVGRQFIEDLEDILVKQQGRGD